MFVKVVTPNEESMYDCSRTGHRSSPEDEDTLILTIFNKDGTKEVLDVDKKNSDVYFMNDDGKTVDRITCR